ncbi:MAG: hypothetical protein V1921_06450 [Candidatus Altiarchaeota archaeon]
MKLEGHQLSEKLPKLKDPVIREALELYSQLLYDVYASTPTVEYPEYLRRTEGFNMTPAQLQEMLDVWEKSSQDFSGPVWANDAVGWAKMGVFATALMQNSKHNNFEFELKRAHLQYLGCFLTQGKSIKVKGDLGQWTGWGLQGGRIEVDGNLSFCTGQKMKAGEIIVNGDISRMGAIEMEGGLIHVKGDAEEYLGNKMKAGKVIVDGKLKGVSEDYISGEIYNKNVRVKP